MRLAEGSREARVEVVRRMRRLIEQLEEALRAGHRGGVERPLLDVIETSGVGNLLHHELPGELVEAAREAGEIVAIIRGDDLAEAPAEGVPGAHFVEHDRIGRDPGLEREIRDEHPGDGVEGADPGRPEQCGLGRAAGREERTAASLTELGGGFLGERGGDDAVWGDPVVQDRLLQLTGEPRRLAAPGARRDDVDGPLHGISPRRAQRRSNAQRSQGGAIKSLPPAIISRWTGA